MLLRDANLDAIAFPLAPPPPILNPTAESTEKDATSGGIHDSVPCLVVDLRLEDDTVVDCQSSERSSVSNSESEEACRICHVSSGCTGSASELIELRCGCKNGLGVVHKHCAEAWFRIKGNRYMTWLGWIFFSLNLNFIRVTDFFWREYKCRNDIDKFFIFWIKWFHFASFHFVVETTKELHIKIIKWFVVICLKFPSRSFAS